ncbi:putative lipoprotein NlpE involved in copper resistance [Caldalkalibacillus uzonensis]|uniref:Lipoprotein NlpE involved in copper resistance n=1 Tax=Caldalkalibacillus uzonensis TaxID=353224 RepID=A0ABU0CS83_9BACI|nr:SurA N-terminal domain-containing protein [Caldalkalibacillus uzonensis]MDQ0339209.1 putative lipoprotein NlpE involved in copper resistance [Caldalkalibacillus uzonensis]
MKKTLVAFLLGVLMLTLIACGNQQETADESPSVAIVNGTEISQEQLDAHLEQIKMSYAQFGIDFEGEEGQAMLEQLKEEVLNGLIEQQVLLQAAQSEGYTADPEQVDEALADIKAQFASEEELQEILDSLGFSMEDLREELANELVITQYLDDQIGEIELSEEEQQEAYLSYEEETGEEADEETKQMIREQLRWQKEGELRQELVERLKQESEIEILL